MKFQLYENQLPVIAELRKAWKTHRTNLIYANVGFGKTAISYHLVSSMNARGLRVLFVAPYTTLVEQTASRFMQYGLEQPSIIWQSHDWYDPYNLCQIASVDTLIRREFPNDIDLMIVDECHIKRRVLLEIIESASFPVIGLSGTPFTDWLGNYYENLIKTTTMRKMIDSGKLSDFEIFAPTKPNLKGVRTSKSVEFGGDYLEGDIAEIMNGADIVGDIIENWVSHGENRSTIAFCCNVLHANHVANGFVGLGVSAEVMTAKTPKDERLQTISRFEQGITRIICNVGVLVAGFDSDVRCIIYARPTKSEIRWIQCLGRGLRTAAGKDKCLIFDHSGTVHRLGFPDDIEYSYLKSDKDGKDKAEAKAQEIEKEEKLPKECTKCNFMKPAGVPKCPKCGHLPRMGQDVEVDETRGLTSLNGKRVATRAEKQVFFSELKGIQRQSFNEGKKPLTDGYIAHTFKSKFKEWPNGLSGAPIQPSESTVNFVKHKRIKYAQAQKRLIQS